MCELPYAAETIVGRASYPFLQRHGLDENREREALNDYDASKMRLAEIRQAEADLKAKATQDELRAQSAGNSRSRGRGRPKDVASRKSVAKAIGTSETAVHNTEKHVALAEQYPFLQRRSWVQHSVLEAGVGLETLPELDVPPIVGPASPPHRPLYTITAWTPLVNAVHDAALLLTTSRRAQLRAHLALLDAAALAASVLTGCHASPTRCSGP